MAEPNADKHSEELAAVRSSQHLSAWLLAFLLLVLIVLGVYQIVQAYDHVGKMDAISSRIGGIENRLNQMQMTKKDAPVDAKKPVEPKTNGD